MENAKRRHHSLSALGGSHTQHQDPGWIYNPWSPSLFPSQYTDLLGRHYWCDCNLAPLTWMQAAYACKNSQDQQTEAGWLARWPLSQVTLSLSAGAADTVWISWIFPLVSKLRMTFPCSSSHEKKSLWSILIWLWKLYREIFLLKQGEKDCIHYLFLSLDQTQNLFKLTHRGKN